MTNGCVRFGSVGVLLALASCTRLEIVGLSGDGLPVPGGMRDAAIAATWDAASADAGLSDSAHDARMDEPPTGDSGASEAEHEEGEEEEEEEEDDGDER